MFYLMPQNVAHFPNISYLCAKHMLMKRLDCWLTIVVILGALLIIFYFIVSPDVRYSFLFLAILIISFIILQQICYGLKQIKIRRKWRRFTDILVTEGGFEEFYYSPTSLSAYKDNYWLLEITHNKNIFNIHFLYNLNPYVEHLQEECEMKIAEIRDSFGRLSVPLQPTIVSDVPFGSLTISVQLARKEATDKLLREIRDVLSNLVSTSFTGKKYIKECFNDKTYYAEYNHESVTRAILRSATSTEFYDERHDERSISYDFEMLIYDCYEEEPIEEALITEADFNAIWNERER